MPDVLEKLACDRGVVCFRHIRFADLVSRTVSARRMNRANAFNWNIALGALSMKLAHKNDEGFLFISRQFLLVSQSESVQNGEVFLTLSNIMSYLA